MTGKRITRSFSTPLSAAPDKVFPLLCPVREYEWLPTWQCELIFSQSGYAELGCVFTTDFNDGAGIETWVICTYEKQKKIGFIKTGSHTTTRYEIMLTPAATGSIIEWQQELTSLDERGRQLIENISENAYQKKMAHINHLLEYYLKNGKIME